MTGTDIASVEGSFLTPSFEHARVHEAMRAGVITCPPETPLRTVARMMAGYHVHAIVVTGADAEGEDERPWRVLTDLDLARAAGPGFDDRDAHGAASSRVDRVSSEDSLEDAVKLMVERGVSHLVVAAPVSDRPIGVLSTLDVAGILAWGRR